MCTQIGCQTPLVRKIKYRMWLYGVHYDFRSLKAVNSRLKRMQWYDKQAAKIQEVKP